MTKYGKMAQSLKPDKSTRIFTVFVTERPWLVTFNFQVLGRGTTSPIEMAAA
jgi:hypothetical protein